MRGLTTLDVLLAEAEEGDYDSYDSAAEYEFYNGPDPADFTPYSGRTFHPFSKLPPELRIKVWELALAGEAQPRILHFGLDLVPPRSLDFNDLGSVVIDWTVQTSAELAKETRHVRRIVAVNREARGVVLKTLPHTLELPSRKSGRRPATVYFHRDRDVAYLTAGDIFLDTLLTRLRGDWQHGGRCIFEGFAENVTQLAIDYCSLSVIEGRDITRLYTHILEPFSNLQRLFIDLPPSRQLTLGDRIWAGSEYVYTHEVAIRDRGNGYFRKMHVWPNADEYDAFARQLALPNVDELGLPSPDGLMQLGHGAMILPMFVFEDHGGYRAFEKLRTSWQEAYARGIPVDELTDWSSDSDNGIMEEYIDQYESEGIDDSIIEEYWPDDDGEEIDLSGDQNYGDDESSEGDDDDDSDGNTGSDAENDHRDEHNVSNENAAAFSSPKPEPSSTVNSRKRRIVADSDDELPSEVPNRKQARNGGFSSGTGSDTEDEGVSEASAARKRRRRGAVVDSDDEDDDDGDDGIGGKGKQNGESRKKNNDVGPEEEDEEEEEDDDDDTSDEDDGDDDEDEDEQNEAADVRRLSLAARLQLVPPRHRSSRNRRIDSTDDEEDEEDDDDDDDDDDEDVEDDEDDERSEDELIDGIAEESDMSD
ncbi:hypothetical protein TgHK011_008351 [Trichoderma gracile]|nr:hypothetical protein TgHK011_008351 [Trichoderma gracile]